MWSSEATLGDYKERPNSSSGRVLAGRQGNADQFYDSGVYGSLEIQRESGQGNGVDRSTKLAIYEHHGTTHVPNISNPGSP